MIGTPGAPNQSTVAETSEFVLNVQFWMNRQDWPKPPSKKIFLGDALHVVGRHIFGDGWTGAEPWVRKLAPRGAGTQFDRLRGATEAIVSISDRVQTYGCSSIGSKWKDLPDHVWNMGLRDPLQRRFFDCRMHWEEPNQLDVLVPKSLLLFFDRDEFESALSYLAQSGLPAVPDRLVGARSRSRAPYANQYWSAGAQRDLWPSDTPTHVFLGRAVDQLGQAFFGIDWSADAPSLPRPTIARPPGPQGTDYIEDFLAARRQIADVESRQAWANVLQVQDGLLAAAASGEIVLAHRPVRHPVLTVIPREWWAAGPMAHVFVRCTIDPNAPLAEEVTASRGHYLFVARDGLESIVRRAADAVVETTRTAKAGLPVSLREWAQAQYAQGIGWTVAYRNLQELQAQGLYPKASRSKLEALFKEWDPSPKRGPKPAG